ncbi:MAG: hypothetical protein J2P58_09140 [Acidimicrobiaceae bacterium]|nr:hypothetical protein [Acidimicrobiaceae bacterium]
MSTRFVTGALLMILGGFVVVVSQAFTATVLGWVSFGVAIGVIVVCGLAQLDGTRGGIQRSLDSVSVVAAALLMAFALAASGTAVMWLSFAFALGIVAFALTGLTLHEVTNWRDQHRLASLHWLHEPESAATVEPYRTA